MVRQGKRKAKCKQKKNASEQLEMTHQFIKYQEYQDMDMFWIICELYKNA